MPMGQLDDAVKAHRAAQNALATAQENAAVRVRAARDQIEKTRAELAAAIVAEALAGVSQVEIIRRTGYSRERVRTILRAGGVEAD